MARPKGATNHQSKAIKDMITAALDAKGGQEYFIKQADENPAAFMTLIGKILPKDISLVPDDNGNPPTIHVKFS